MNLALTLCYITARHHPKTEWLLESLRRQIAPSDNIQIIIVDLLKEERELLPGFPTNFWSAFPGVTFEHVLPKPSVWAGKHRLTKENWWIVSAQRNSGVCLARHDTFAVCDDRSVLDPQWMDAVRDALAGNYAVCGTYEKTHHLRVENGLVQGYVEPSNAEGNPTGKDHRASGGLQPRPIGGSLFFGCNSAFPLEWALNINGWDESCDALGMEDCIFGQMLERNGYPIMFDERMKLWEDRTPGQIEDTPKRTDKGISPFDKSHGLLKRTEGKLQATHEVNLREIRARLASGEPFEIPTTPTHDWWDSQPLAEF